ncbi:MAG: AAA domain-containing protein [Balneolaceae bacterium]
MDRIKSLLEKAVIALESEIETVREKPSTDVLFNGVKSEKSDRLSFDYIFECHQPAIRFAEEIKAKTGEKSFTIHPVLFEDKKVVLRFPEDLGKKIEQVYLEWENDFILKRTLGEIFKLESRDDGVRERLERLFHPDGEKIPSDSEVLHDDHRNIAQLEAIQRAMSCRTLFIWGPPGTGKTDTLGYIIGNYLKAGKRVLFASNTNRAVDVGLLSSLQAMKKIGLNIDHNKITRFGESALEDEDLEPFQFDLQIEKIVNERKREAGEWIDLLSRREKALRSVEKRLGSGKKLTSNQELELKLIEQKIENAGGMDALESKIEEIASVSDRKELWKKRFVATTLAKVCTSDLFHDLDFDAVVVDEGSMANLPYLMVLASHAKWHMVVVGDPMQLPPIALTSDQVSREFLERDIFTTVSGADTSEELFGWHDKHQDFTAFFDTQYRLESSLADIISTVFYEGRLKTGKNDEIDLNRINDKAFHLVDTSKYGPILEQKSSDRGFNPVNTVHQDIIVRLIQNMEGRGIFMEQVGIIVPFRSVVYDLRNRLYDAGIRNVEVGTIHTFQGREKDYIIFDTVMSGEQQHGKIRHYSVRPLDEEKNGMSVPRLLNVAFSRSRKELVVIADMGHIHKIYGNKFLGRLLKRML